MLLQKRGSYLVIEEIALENIVIDIWREAHHLAAALLQL